MSSDEEYIQTLSSGDEASRRAITANSSKHQTRSTGGTAGATFDKSVGGGDAGKSVKGAQSSHGGRSNWEVSRTWENVVEGEDGTISGTVDGLLEAGKRKRLLKDTTPLQRGIIRHLVLVLDLSHSTLEKDLRPSRYLLSIRYAMEFVHEYFEQNPISQLGILGMRDGIAMRISDLSGNPTDHVEALQKLRTQDPKGDASLQNALEMARGALFHAPTHTTREVLLIFSALLSSDPGSIQTTITKLVAAKISVSIIGLAAELAICRTIVTRTNPGLDAASVYGVALNEQHFRDLIMRGTVPPVKAASTGERKSQMRKADMNGASDSAAQKKTNGEKTAEEQEEEDNASTLLTMGFPSRILTPFPTLCACHSRPSQSGYLCSRCKTKVCGLPATCPCCGLTLILSTHLARSYHHLFPLRNWDVVGWARVMDVLSRERKLAKIDRGARRRPEGREICFGCMAPFPQLTPSIKEKVREERAREAAHRRRSSSGRRNSNRQGNGGMVEKEEDGGAAAAAAAGRTNGTKDNVMAAGGREGMLQNVSESGRYECPACRRFFCVDCDLFAHEVVHNCPGCLSGGGVDHSSINRGEPIRDRRSER
ncbi:hypothetical protein MMC25_000928 [Agyrium rufum]|nr:hypothetical protein [Agyrium rufum]